MSDTVEVNGRGYRPPVIPTAVVCIDGSDPRYLDDALARGLMPRLEASLDDGATYAVGRSQLPSFTNPNNLSIVTGAPPAVHGVPGNHYLDPAGEEVPLDDPRFLRAPTIHAVLAERGVPVACVTTKDKLRRLLAAGGVPCLSAERIGEQRLPELGVERPAELVGRPAPGIYDPECSIYALELGLALARRLGPCLLYVSLTDSVQHLEGPGRPAASRFYERLDEQWGAYLDAGLCVALVADHGMNAKPRILYLEDELSAAGIAEGRAVLPITDPYVVHHAALGSAAWVHVPAAQRADAASCLRALDGVEEVLEREVAASTLELPADRIGDLVVLADERTALGSSRSKHDLSTLRGPLRSHGGRHEQEIPVVISHPLTDEAARRLEQGITNADVHALVLNGIA